MGRYLARRLGQSLFILLGITLVTYLLLFLLPADPVRQIAGRSATPAVIESIRSQLGLDINDLVQGDVALEVLVSRDAQNEQAVHVRADLLNAELTLDSIAWKKPKGRAALFEFDYAKGSGALPIELRNVKLVGDNVALVSPYVVMLLVLLARPYGLFGTPEVRRV